MTTNFARAVKTTLVGWARVAGRAIKRLLKPARTVVAATAGVARDVMRTRPQLLAENALLRQQVIVLERSMKRPALGRLDRLVMVILARLNATCRDALHLVQPETLLRWHRDLFKTVWARRSRPKGQPNGLVQETIDLIQEMAATNKTWGAERIRGELLKLGIRVSKRTIQKNRGRPGLAVRPVRPGGPSSATMPPTPGLATSCSSLTSGSGPSSRSSS